MPPVFYQIASFLGGFILILFPFAALFGFFENRKNGSYFFRSLRFLAFASLVFAVGIIYYLILLKGSEATILQADKQAYALLERNRAVSLYGQNNLSVMFPSVLNDQNNSCVTIGISNYIEDHWKKFYSMESCKLLEQAQGCGDGEKSVFDIAQKEKNPHHYPMFDFIGAYFAMTATQSTAGDMYKLLKSFSGIMYPPGIGYPDIGTDRQALDSFEGYFKNCASLKPLPWITPDAPFVPYLTHLCLGDCP